MVAIDEDEVELSAVGTDGLLHLGGLGVALEEAPLLAEHEVVDLGADFAEIYGYLFASREARQEEEA